MLFFLGMCILLWQNASDVQRRFVQHEATHRFMSDAFCIAAQNAHAQFSSRARDVIVYQAMLNAKKAFANAFLFI